MSLWFPIQIQPLDHLTSQIVVISIDVIGGELSRRNAPLEHDVHFAKRAVLGLWKAEVAPDSCQEG